MMDESENPYAAPQSPIEEPPRQAARGIVWLMLEIAVAVAIVIALAWLVSTDALPRP
jgi:flagellar biogenesis protein FliO